MDEPPERVRINPIIGTIHPLRNPYFQGDTPTYEGSGHTGPNDYAPHRWGCKYIGGEGAIALIGEVVTP